jgi:GNAT superfamily N-acetyltransferase
MGADKMAKQCEVLIREAVKADVPRLLELYEELQPADRPVDVNTALGVWERAANGGVTYFVAECDGIVAATCYVAIIPNMTRRCSPIGYIENVVTANPYRRQGIGRKLMAAAVAYAKSRGCYKAILQSGAKRTEAHDFYESIGFDGDSKRAFEIRF